MHWADVVALNLSRRGSKHIVSTGITPSGEFHIGHLREILTGDMIARAASDSGLDVDFIFIVDDADPLRRVYPFLDEEYANLSVIKSVIYPHQKQMVNLITIVMKLMAGTMLITF